MDSGCPLVPVRPVGYSVYLGLALDLLTSVVVKGLECVGQGASSTWEAASCNLLGLQPPREGYRGGRGGGNCSANGPTGGVRFIPGIGILTGQSVLCQLGSGNKGEFYPGKN